MANKKFEELILAGLADKYADIQNRMKLAIQQLSDEQVNWRPNDESNSIANIVIHLKGNVQQRIESLLYKKPDVRQRDKEFSEYLLETRETLLAMIDEVFQLLQATVQEQTTESLLQTIIVRDQEMTVAELLIQIATHYSEHLGQILYIAKLLLGENYVSTSVPKARPHN